MMLIWNMKPNLKQLRENLGSADVKLSQKLLEQIETVHQRYLNPAP